MFLGNLNKVYILDKSENNSAKFGNYPAMGAVYDIASRTATPIEVTTNPFCSSGLHMPNGSFITFGGNSAVGLVMISVQFGILTPTIIRSAKLSSRSPKVEE